MGKWNGHIGMANSIRESFTLRNHTWKFQNIASVFAQTY
jgi:hypothetical protein